MAVLLPGRVLLCSTVGAAGLGVVVPRRRPLSDLPPISPPTQVGGAPRTRGVRSPHEPDVAAHVRLRRTRRRRGVGGCPGGRDQTGRRERTRLERLVRRAGDRVARAYHARTPPLPGRRGGQQM